MREQVCRKRTNEHISFGSHMAQQLGWYSTFRWHRTFSVLQWFGSSTFSIETGKTYPHSGMCTCASIKHDYSVRDNPNGNCFPMVQCSKCTFSSEEEATGSIRDFANWLELFQYHHMAILCHISGKLQSAFTGSLSSLRYTQVRLDSYLSPFLSVQTN